MPVENIETQNNTQNIQSTNANLEQKSQYNARKITVGLAVTSTLIATGLAVYALSNNPQQIIQPTISFLERVKVSATSGLKGSNIGLETGFPHLFVNKDGRPLDSLDWGTIIGAYTMIVGKIYSAL